jgi:hypothetical protein
MYGTVKPDVWVRDIDTTLKKYAKLNEEESKFELIKMAKTWTYYGSSIFQVKDPVRKI